MNLLLEELWSGLPDWREVARVGIRLTFAAVLGGVIGFERQRAGKAAGLRTHMLVSLGAALFVVAGVRADMDSADLSRVIQGLVTGIGFLGGGAILKSRDKHYVEGLTTAAGIWLTAGIGVAAGLGLLGVALLSVALALAILGVLIKVDRFVTPKQENGMPGQESREATDHRDTEKKLDD
jgi:putative Mg2+ transporter-C (MgtC) family protein